MKIRRFVAKDMKTALTQIKDELGVDAVIMSNKKIAEGVELMAAVDYANAPTNAESKIEPIANTSLTDVKHSPAAVSASKNAPGNINDDIVSLSQLSAKVAATEQQAPADSLSALLQRKIQVTEPIPASESKAAAINKVATSDIEQQFKNFTDRLAQSSDMQEKHSVIEPEVTGVEHQAKVNDYIKTQQDVSKPTAEQKNYSQHHTVNTAEFNNMQKEMASIRQLLEHQLSGLMWQDMAQKDPSRALLVNRLMELGLTEHVADQIAGYIPPEYNEQDAWVQAKKLVSEQINTTKNDIIHRGGVFSLVGPTGVGKTTTIAKLAARFAQIHGADQVVLISTDSYRIAGFEQLATYGRIIGCQVKLANDVQTLDTMLQQFSNKKLILIDTAGMGQRDMRLAKHLTTLVSNSRVRIRNYLVLSANTQQRVMQENVDRFKTIPLSGCIFTKLDESLSIGELISTSIQNGLPIGYLTDGQRVPEDIKVANAEKLVTLADRMTNKFNVSSHKPWRTMPATPVIVA